MLQIDNRTRFESALSLFTDPDGTERVAVVTKATFAFPRSGEKCELAAEQSPVRRAHEHHAEPDSSSIRYPVDLTPNKPGTDVVFIGCARTPDDRPLRELACRLRVGPFEREIVALGDREWREIGGAFVIPDPRPFTSMPVTFERAFGGPRADRRRQPAAFDPRNPLGTGFCAEREDVRGMPLPNIEDPKRRIRTWQDRPPVAALGCIAEGWEPRRAFAGTYDQHWRETRFPLLPADFDPRFYLLGCTGLSATQPLRGAFKLELIHLAARPVARGLIPAIDIEHKYYYADAPASHSARLWTVVIDGEREQVCLVWGSSHAVGKYPSRLRGVVVAGDIDKPARVHAA